MTTPSGVSFLSSDGKKWTTLLDLVYPSGSVYLTRQKITPADVLGGTWSLLSGGKCLRTTTSVNGGYGGSDKHVHSVAGPDNWSNTAQRYGVRTSMALGGMNWGDTADNGAATNGGVIWARWAPCRAGSLSNHPGFNAATNGGYDDGHGISFSILKTNVDVWANVAKDGSSKLGNTKYTEQFAASISYNSGTGKYSYTNLYGPTIPGCFGWTRPNSQADHYAWNEQGEYNGDGSVPVAYANVYAYTRS